MQLLKKENYIITDGENSLLMLKYSISSFGKRTK